MRDLVARRSASLPRRRAVGDEPPTVVPQVIIRNKELEQSHICLGASSYPQNHATGMSSYVLNTRARRIDELAAVPERPREARTGLRGVQRSERVSGRRRITIYAGCANEAVDEVIDLCVEELRLMKQTQLFNAQSLRRPLGSASA